MSKTCKLLFTCMRQTRLPFSARKQDSSSSTRVLTNRVLPKSRTRQESRPIVAATDLCSGVIVPAGLCSLFIIAVFVAKTKYLEDRAKQRSEAFISELKALRERSL